MCRQVFNQEELPHKISRWNPSSSDIGLLASLCSVSVRRGSRSLSLSLSLPTSIRSHVDSERGSVDFWTEELLSSPICSVWHSLWSQSQKPESPPELKTNNTVALPLRREAPLWRATCCAGHYAAIALLYCERKRCWWERAICPSLRTVEGRERRARPLLDTAVLIHTHWERKFSCGMPDQRWLQVCHGNSEQKLEHELLPR